MKKYLGLVVLVLPLMILGCCGSSSSSDDDDGDAATTYTVSGTISVQIGGLDGVTLTLAPVTAARTDQTATSAADGTFSITGVEAGAYTLTPSKTDFVFTPTNIAVTVSAADVTAQDFTAEIDDTTFTIAFNVIADVDVSDVYTMTLDGENRTRLTTNHESTIPRFSSDKTKILYNLGTDSVYVMDSDGTDAVKVTPDGATPAEPSFASSDSLVVYSNTSGDDFEVFSVPSDGSAAPTQLTTLTGDNWGALVFPAGDACVFSSKADGATYYDVYGMNIDGTDLTNLTSNDSMDSLYMSVSGDGTKIAYTGNYGGGVYDVFLMDADGNNVVNISNDADSANQSSSVSYDGTKVVFDSDRDHGGSHSEIYIANADGTELTRLTTTTDEDTSHLNYRPQFLRDGRILFLSLRDVLPQIYVMDADGSDQTLVSDGSTSDNDVLGGWDKPSF